jgi:hypothetical protein
MTPAQEQLDKVKGILNQDAKKRLFDKTRGSVTGSAIGLTAGALYVRRTREPLCMQTAYKAR